MLFHCLEFLSGCICSVQIDMAVAASIKGQTWRVFSAEQSGELWNSWWKVPGLEWPQSAPATISRQKRVWDLPSGICG